MQRRDLTTKVPLGEDRVESERLVSIDAPPSNLYDEND